jgi:hypothetical protein
MKVLVLYRPFSEHARKVEEFLRDLQRQHDVEQKNLQVIDIDSRDGISTASLYDVMTTPAIVVITDAGGYVTSWTGPDLPLLRDVAVYTFAR